MEVQQFLAVSTKKSACRSERWKCKNGFIDVLFPGLRVLLDQKITVEDCLNRWALLNIKEAERVQEIACLEAVCTILRWRGAAQFSLFLTGGKSGFQGHSFGTMLREALKVHRLSRHGGDCREINLAHTCKLSFSFLIHLTVWRLSSRKS